MSPSVVLLFLISLCPVMLCQDYAYHFINHNKTWSEAQQYCRENYTDLAYVYDLIPAERVCGSAANCTGAWIGLTQESNRTWHWSGRNENRNSCILLHTECQRNVSCAQRSYFICYNESSSSNLMYAPITNTSSLVKALEVCQHTCNQCWMNLLRDTWTWSDNNNSSFRNWDQDEVYTQQLSGQRCARLGHNNTWMSDNCTEEHPFICYDNQMMLVRENKTWEEALYYCRRNHGDLAVMTSVQQLNMVQERANMADSTFVWVGLHYTCFLEEWLWVDGKYVSANDQQWNDQLSLKCGMAGAMKKAGGLRWYKEFSEIQYQFVCSVRC